YEDADNYHVKVELPGVRKEDISVELENSVLSISAKQAQKGQDGEARAEYNRSLAVPEGIDPAKVGAHYENGVLTVTFPKPEGRKPRQINVN
ncbi:MAG: Hsp20/alpha crystallin family protein, partial [Gammaproteobacteria bacterium]